MDLTSFVKVEFLALIPILNLIGLWIKKSKLPNKYIPATLGGVGILLAMAYTLLNPGEAGIWPSLLTGAIQGILCAAAAVYGNQIVKQAGKDETEVTVDTTESGDTEV